MGEFVPPNMIKLVCVRPQQHWGPPAHGDVEYPHQTAPDGTVYITVPREISRHFLAAGYAHLDDPS
jgi:hypothetical protein